MQLRKCVCPQLFLENIIACNHIYCMIGECNARGKSTNGIRKGWSGHRNPAARGKRCE